MRRSHVFIFVSTLYSRDQAFAWVSQSFGFVTFRSLGIFGLRTYLRRFYSHHGRPSVLSKTYPLPSVLWKSSSIVSWISLWTRVHTASLKGVRMYVYE